MGSHPPSIHPLWENAGLINRGALNEDLRTDVCVVGAGIAGVSVAYQLARENQSVVVIDDGAIGGGETLHTTAHLSNAFDDRYSEMEKVHGEELTRLIAASHTAAIEQIDELIYTEGIDCDFERLDGYLYVPEGKSRDILNSELEAAHRAGLKDVELLDRVPGLAFDTGPCLRFPRQGQFHPIKYLRGLVAAAEKLGVRFHGGTRAKSIDGGIPAKVVTDSGRVITSGAVVVATNTPINDMFAIHTKQAAYRTYAVGLRAPRSAFPKILLWDESYRPENTATEAYHYVRLAEDDHDSTRVIMVVGGEDHKTGQADDGEQRLDRLEAWARERFPGLEEVAYRWSGQVMEPVDGVAYIGLNPGDEENVFIATGDSGMGMTHGTIAGMLLRDLILHRDNPWARLYDPSRVRLRAAGEYARENLNVAAQYTDYLTPGEVESVEHVVRGSGALIRRGMTKIAVYRDENGTLIERSAVCPHMGCIVQWNDSSKTWDCPCHGSRFDCTGRMINGPANTDLAEIEESERARVK